MALRRKDGARLLSLAELMYEYKIGNLALMLGSAISVSRDLGTSDQLEKPILTDEYCKQLALIIEGLRLLCQNFEVDPSLKQQLEILENDLKSGLKDRREAVLCARLDLIISGVQNNLNSRKFMYIPANQAVYWENMDMFGEYFALSFPHKATLEMLEAGKCYAAGRGTACVFHCMRVAEYALRKIAKKLKVSVVHKKKNCPLEYADWDKVITGIKNKITEIRNRPNGPRKETALRFYSNAADHCEYMKDIWRNEVMHTRRFYNEAETQAVVNRVRDFCLLFNMSEEDALKELEKRERRIQQVQPTHGRSAPSTP